ncbi:MAG: GNAT family N-acetyltransferase [Alphaproteobacteria bacterium]
MAIRDLLPEDLPWVHALNQVHAEELSSMSMTAFAEMVGRARYARVIDPEAAFLLAFDQQPTDESPNFQWFKSRCDGFLYIDRVCVDAGARRQGHGATLYTDLFDFCRNAGYKSVTAEVNSDPPNPASDAFHNRQSFHVIGEARLPLRQKTVRYYQALLD